MLAHQLFESAATRSHVRGTKDSSVVGMKVPPSLLLLSELDASHGPRISQVEMVELCQRITALGGHFLAKLLALLQQVQPSSLRYDQAQWVFDAQTFTDLTLSKVQDFVEESLKDHANNNNTYTPTKPTTSTAANHQLNDNAFGLDHDLYSVAAWRCKSCTLQNPEASTVCDMCWASRYGEPSFTNTPRGGLINTPRGGEGDAFWNGNKTFLDGGNNNHRGGKLFSGLNSNSNGKHLASFEMDDNSVSGGGVSLADEENETPDGHQQPRQQHVGGKQVLLPPMRFSTTPRGYDAKRHRRERSTDSFINAIMSTSVHEQDDYAFDAPPHNFGNGGLALARNLSSASSVGNVGGLSDLAALADSVLLQQPSVSNPVAEGLLAFQRGYRGDTPYERSLSPSHNVSPTSDLPKRRARVQRQRSSTLIETEMAANVLTNHLPMASLPGHQDDDEEDGDALVQRMHLASMSEVAVGDLPAKKRKSMHRTDSMSSSSTGIMSTCSTMSSGKPKRAKTMKAKATAASRKKKATATKSIKIVKKKTTVRKNKKNTKTIQDTAAVDVARELESVSIGGKVTAKTKSVVTATGKKVTKRRGSVELLPTYNDEDAVLEAKHTFNEPGTESVIEGVHVFHAEADPNKLRWKCRVCAKGFKQRIYLRVHVRTHTGARPIPCPKCPARFADPSNLRVHVRAHEGRMHACEWAGCERMFPYRHSLREHMLGHTNQHPHKCECGQEFRNKSNMKKHQKKRCKLLVGATASAVASVAASAAAAAFVAAGMTVTRA